MRTATHSALTMLFVLTTLGAAAPAATAAPADSCLGHCGTMAPAGCWCDDYCVAFGDCCSDKAQACTVAPIASSAPSGLALAYPLVLVDTDPSETGTEVVTARTSLTGQKTTFRRDWSLPLAEGLEWGDVGPGYSSWTSVDTAAGMVDVELEGKEGSTYVRLTTATLPTDVFLHASSAGSEAELKVLVYGEDDTFLGRVILLRRADTEFLPQQVSVTHGETPWHSEAYPAELNAQTLADAVAVVAEGQPVGHAVIELEARCSWSWYPAEIGAHGSLEFGSP